MNGKKIVAVTIIIALIGGLTGCASQTAPAETPVHEAATTEPAAEPPGGGDMQTPDIQWTLILAEEFDGENGSSPNPELWTLETGNNNGWGNRELQYYTDRTDNCYLEDGCLVIKAMEEEMEGFCYTSARLKTKGKFQFRYGKVEMRAKLPRGQGIWPAFWMLGSDIADVGWPGCGEIDIMEFIGREPVTVYGTLHGPGYSGSMGLQGSVRCNDLHDSFHTYGVIWDHDAIEWYFDGEPYFRVEREKLTKLYPWAYDREFFLLLNLAIGGQWPRNPDETTVFPQYYTIDYVRVYQQAE